MAGFPPPTRCTRAEMRRLLRRRDALTHAVVVRVLGTTAERADAILREACRLGYLNWAPVDGQAAWTRAAFGLRLTRRHAADRSPAPDHGALMPGRTILSPQEFDLPETLRTAEPLHFGIPELSAHRLRLLLSGADGLARRIDLRDALALTLPEETGPPRDWRATLRAASGEIERLAEEPHAMLQLDCAGPDSASAAIALASWSDQTCRSLRIRAAARAPDGCVQASEGAHALGTIRAAWRFLPALRGAAGWMAGVEDLELSVRLAPGDAISAGAPPPFPATELASVRRALSDAVAFGQPEDGWSRREISACNDYDGLRFNTSHGVGADGRPRAAARRAAEALAARMREALGRQTRVGATFREFVCERPARTAGAGS